MKGKSRKSNGDGDLGGRLYLVSGNIDTCIMHLPRPTPPHQSHPHQATKRKNPAKLLAQLDHTRLQPSLPLRSCLPAANETCWCVYLLLLTHRSVLRGSEPAATVPRGSLAYFFQNASGSHGARRGGWGVGRRSLS